MDLESELKQAMAERVAPVSAPTSLVADVHRRHRRRVARVRTTVMTAAAVAVVVTVTPMYQAHRAVSTGAHDATAGTGPATASTALIQPLPTVSPDPRSTPGVAG